MAEDEQSGFVDRILRQQLGEFVEWKSPEQLPMLGQGYLDAMQTLRQRVDDFVYNQRFILLAQDLSDLHSCYEPSGSLKGNTVQEYWSQVRSDTPVSTYTHEIYLAGLRRPDFLPEYAYWSRMQWLQIDEVLWLALGLNPEIRLIDTLKDPKQKRRGRPAEFAHVNAVREQLARFAPGATMGTNKFKGPELLAWIEATEFPCNTAFVQMLSKAVERQSDPGSVSHDWEPIDAESLSDPRTVLSVAKIVTAIAVHEYGYEPHSERSPIPKEIQDIMDELGMQGSAKTVLKYLRLGSRGLQKKPKGKNK